MHLSPSRHTLHAIKIAGLLLLFGVAASAANRTDLIREQKVVTINGIAETWRLEWTAPPQNVCGADEGDVSLTCPCSGFAYGEEGHLALVRIRPGEMTERLNLDRYFLPDWLPTSGAGPAVLQRWPPLEIGPDNDFKLYARSSVEGFVRAVERRSQTDVMKLADYNHDGWRTKFLLQVGTLPCGKHMMVLVGISKKDPHLHVFSAIQHPGKPLVLGAWEWAALLKSKGPVSVITWHCGDHGSDTESKDVLAAQDGAFSVINQRLECSKIEQQSAPFDSTPPQ